MPSSSFIVSFLVLLLCSLLEYQHGYLREMIFSTSREKKAMIGLENVIRNNGTNYQNVAVGVNANVDLILSAIKLFQQLGLSRGSSPPTDHTVITSLNDLEECFAFYFKKCAAAERFVSDKDVFEEIVKAAVLVEGATYDVGGNAAIMGLKMLYTSRNSKVTLGGPIGPKLMELLNGELLIPDKLRKDVDEYHLILEYGVSEVWGDHTSACGNRFIISHDVSNGQMTAMDNFFESVKTSTNDMIVVSGLHLLEGQTVDTKHSKIELLQSHLRNIPSNIPIHLELASMTSLDLMRDIANGIFPLVDSIGLNEQELSFISLALDGPGVKEELGQWPPEIGLMSDVIDWLLHTFGRNLRHGSASSRLTRIHFHCLTYHVIATLPYVWENSLVATAAGSRAASRQACDIEQLREQDVELRTPEVFARSVTHWDLRRSLVKGDEGNPVSSWHRGDVNFFFSAVLVCRKPKRTVGLGDCISATGLQYSKFLNT